MSPAATGVAVTSTLIGIGMEKSSIVCEYATASSPRVSPPSTPATAMRSFTVASSAVTVALTCETGEAKSTGTP